MAHTSPLDGDQAILECTQCLIAGYAKMVESQLSSESIVYQSYADIHDLIFLYFYDDKVQPTPSLIATHYGFRDLTIRFWYTHKDETNEIGETALHIAAKLGHEQTVHALIDLGADVNEEGQIGETPLITASRGGQSQIVKLLLREPDIEVNRQRAEDGATALFAASREGHLDCVRHLLTKDTIHVDLPKLNQRTPLWIASFFGFTEIMKLLLKFHKMGIKPVDWGHTADVNRADHLGFTPLFAAAQNNHYEAVRLLLKYEVCAMYFVKYKRTDFQITYRLSMSETQSAGCF